MSQTTTNTASVLRCRDLKKSFGGVCAVDLPAAKPVFEPGRVTALIGSNGAGKTTLFHLLTGQLKPDVGEVLLGKQRIDGLAPWRIAHLGVGRLFQDVRVFEKLSVLDNVRVAFRRQRGENPLLSVLARRAVRKQETVNTEEAQRLLVFVGLEEYGDARAESLSYGQQKLLALARLLAADATTLLLDEPTAGVNPYMVEKLLELIRRLAREGKTVVLVEHNMEVVEAIADHVFFMHEGRIIAEGIPSEVLNDPEIRATYLGLA